MPTAVPVDDLVTRIHNEREELLRAAEAILMETDIPADASPYNIRGRFDRRELATFDALRWSDDEIWKAAARCRSVRNHQHAVGTSEDRSAAEDHAAETAAKLATREPEIVAELQRLQAELDGLRTEAAKASRKVESQRAAVVNLRQLVPPHVREQFNQTKRDIKSEYRELGDLEQRLTMIRSLVALDASGDKEAILLAVRGHDEFPENIVKRDNGLTILDADVWKRAVGKMAGELGTLAEQVTSGKAAMAARIADAEREILDSVYAR